MSVPFRSVRLQRYGAVQLDRLSYEDGEVFYDTTNDTLRLMDGKIPGGLQLASQIWTNGVLTTNLANYSTLVYTNNQLALKAPIANPTFTGTVRADQFIGTGIGAFLSDSPPIAPIAQTGTMWFNTGTGKLYIYYNDGNSTQWVQPMTPSVGGGGGGGSAGVGTINSGSAGKLAYYPSAGTTVDDLTSIGWSGSTLSITGGINVSAQKNYVRFHWDTLADLNAEAPAVTWHGMVAHVHATGRLYVAHSSNWLPLALLSDVAVTGIQAGTNVTVSSVGGVYTINAASGGSGGGITTEDAQDATASLFSNGTQTGISFTYDDLGNALSATVGTVALGSGTSGNYVSRVQNGTGITGGSAGSAGAALTLAIDTAVVSTLTGIQTLTNKTISGASNTITNIGNTSLTNSSITINGTAVSLGGTISISSASTLDNLTNVTITTPSTGQVLKYNGTRWINDVDATSGGAGVGTVTSVSVTGANGFAGTVATSSSTPAITITTSITGLLKGNATAISAAVAGTDYQAPVSATGILKSSGVSGNVSAATAGTDYQLPITLTTTGSSGLATFSGNTLNIPQYSGGGATTFNTLTDASSAGLTVDKVYLPAITRLDVTANGSASYSFDQYATTNPTIYAISGLTVAFNLNVSGHPFLIQTSGGTNYSVGLIHVSTTGVVNSGALAQGQTSGTLYWKIPFATTGNYRYICSLHAGMVGVITIKDFSIL